MLSGDLNIIYQSSANTSLTVLRIYVPQTLSNTCFPNLDFDLYKGRILFQPWNFNESFCNDASSAWLV